MYNQAGTKLPIGMVEDLVRKQISLMRAEAYMHAEREPLPSEISMMADQLANANPCLKDYADIATGKNKASVSYIDVHVGLNI